MITFNKVSKSYNDGASHAVSELNLTIEDGELLVMLGSSGSGKSTTLKMINRLVTPSRGEITLDNTNINDYNLYQLRRSIGYVFQKIGLFPHLTVHENLAIVLRLEKMKQADIDQRIESVLALVNLSSDEYFDRYPEELSGGQQQRIGVARALINQPKVLLMDEPFSALDAINRRELQDEIKQLHQRVATTIVFVTHDLVEAFRLADRIAVFNQGQLQQVGTKQAIMHQPATPFVKQLIDNQRAQIQEFNQMWMPS